MALNGEISGFNNTASGGSLENALISGFFNTGVPTQLSTTQVSGGLSGSLNTGSIMSGLFNIDRL